MFDKEFCFCGVYNFILFSWKIFRDSLIIVLKDSKFKGENICIKEMVKNFGFVNVKFNLYFGYCRTFLD